MKPEQLDVTLIKGRDYFAVLPTGFGKRLWYACLPVAFYKFTNKERDYSIVTPSLAIMKDHAAKWTFSKCLHHL